MNEYKYELHCHTSEVSRCAGVCAADAVEAYVQAGYSGVVITDHYNSRSFELCPGASLDERIDFYLSGYRAAKKAAAGRIDILLGMELCFFESINDYLVYGVTEQFLREHPDLMEMGLERFSALAHENGMLVFHAHPFRNGVSVSNPALVDGYEVYNGNARHDSRNDIAYHWAQKFGKLMVSGSDYHQLDDEGKGGIAVKEPIRDIATLLDVLRSGRAELLRR